jgi:hypothetical protein
MKGARCGVRQTDLHGERLGAIGREEAASLRMVLDELRNVVASNRQNLRVLGREQCDEALERRATITLERLVVVLPEVLRLV